MEFAVPWLTWVLSFTIGVKSRYVNEPQSVHLTLGTSYLLSMRMRTKKNAKAEQFTRLR